jgi:hypothetical protein
MFVRVNAWKLVALVTGNSNISQFRKTGGKTFIFPDIRDTLSSNESVLRLAQNFSLWNKLTECYRIDIHFNIMLLSTPTISWEYNFFPLIFQTKFICPFLEKHEMQGLCSELYIFCVKKFSAFIEPEGPLQCSEET